MTMFGEYVPDTFNSRKLLIKGGFCINWEKELDENIYLFKSSVSTSTWTDIQSVANERLSKWRIEGMLIDKEFLSSQLID